jgi:hypothetical protein
MTHICLYILLLKRDVSENAFMETAIIFSLKGTFFARKSRDLRCRVHVVALWSLFALIFLLSFSPEFMICEQVFVETA